MKKLTVVVAIVLASIFSFSCSKESTPAVPPTPAPTVDFSYSGTTAPAPALIGFSSNVTNGTTYVWDFGDNGSSTEANPQHSYTLGGTYTVKLTVTGSGGTSFVTKTINILQALTKVKITKVTLVNIPFTKPGGTSGWDLDGSGPDIFFQIQDINSNVLFDATSANRKNDLQPSNLPISWDFTSPFFLVTDLSQNRFIQFWDYDSLTANEDMGYVGFLFSTYTTGSNPYPATVTNTRQGVTVTLNLTWY